jgi:ferric-dicitrate binding protein FerR (iron transport regulator)
MSSDPHLTRLAATALAEEPLPFSPPSGGERARTVDAMKHAIRARATARRRRRWAISATALAASVALAFGAVSALRRQEAPSAMTAQSAVTAHAIVQGALRLDHAGESRLINGSSQIAAGDRVVAVEERPGALVLSTGTRLVLPKGSELTVVEDAKTQSFALGTGSVHAEVAKLHAGERFLVTTTDAEVEVRGTSFLVETLAEDSLCEGGERTRVTVDEGTVVVRAHGGESRVTAGQQWPAGCAPRVSPAPPTATPGAPPERGDHVASPPKPTTAPRAAAAPTDETAKAASSDLRVQNALFTQALAAKRRGDTAEALRAIGLLLERYPGTPLAENALVERMRLSSGTAAIRAARAYLTRYPNGFARAEAEEIAGP